MLNFRLASMALAFSLASSFSSRARDQDRAPAAVAAESSAPHHFSPAPEALAALKGFQIPAGLHADLWASEPLLKNPVAFNFDDQGRVYVCETYRLFHGVDDIRRIMGWLDEELAARTVDDRLAEMKRHLGSQFHTYTEASEKIRLLEDRAGAGRADSSKIFAEGFNSALDGIAAGVLPRDGKVWYTDIPNLWLLRDTNHDGVADSRESLHYGFGVRVGFLGHDLHGLAFGPDGKIYFSIGDRGSNIRITAGKTVGEPDCGSVFRCNPDGSDFEIFAYGLRNPQDLVFDAYGNLFTGDNNSDSGDQARWVYVVEGADNGWRVGYQFMESPYSRGPFNQEKLWYPPFDGQAAYIVPPIANIASGPSGVAYFPGTGLPEKYRDHFFLVDFRGGAANSGIHTFTLKAKGAGFELVNPSHFIWNTLATDVKFSPKGGLYWSDWIDGWGMPDKGRIYRVFDPETQASQLVRETARLLTEGMRHRSARELRSLLEHPDMRVRQNAQFELASHGAPALPDFEHVLQKSSNRFARLHAIWGIGQVLSSHVGAAGKPAVDLLTRALKDRDSEVRGQAAKVLGDCRIKSSSPMLVQSLEDPAPRVRFFSAISIGKVAGPEAIAPVLEMLRENHDQDPWLRHAGVMALTGIRDVDALLASANDPSPSVRMGVLLALRRLQRPEITRFLADKDQRIVLETARAINDEPINGAMPELAALISKPAFATSGEPLIRRVLNANFRFGTPDTARALAAFAGLKAASAPMRVEALEELADWEHPSGRDRVVGLWRPIPATRAAETSAAALSPWFDRITASGTPDTVRIAAIHAAGKLKITSAGAQLGRLVADRKNSGELRSEALRTLGELNDPALDDAVRAAAADPDEKLREAAIQFAAARPNASVLALLTSALENGTLGEKRAALTALGNLQTPQATAILLEQIEKLRNSTLPKELQLDLVEAASKHPAPDLQQALAQYQRSKPAGDDLAAFSEELYGGDAERGRKTFFEQADAQCVRCHKVDNRGGDVGPDLTHIGSQKDRHYLLESVVLPNKQIAPGFESVTVVLKNDEMIAGVLKSETADTLVINSPQKGLVTVKKSQIENRRKGLSPMPEGFGQILSKNALRDLVEFLSTQK